MIRLLALTGGKTITIMTHGRPTSIIISGCRAGYGVPSVVTGTVLLGHGRGAGSTNALAMVTGIPMQFSASTGTIPHTLAFNTCVFACCATSSTRRLVRARVPTIEGVSVSSGEEKKSKILDSRASKSGARRHFTVRGVRVGRVRCRIGSRLFACPLVGRPMRILAFRITISDFRAILTPAWSRMSTTVSTCRGHWRGLCLLVSWGQCLLGSLLRPLRLYYPSMPICRVGPGSMDQGLT